MDVFAYCCESFREATRRAAGVEPVTCPPASVEDFEPGWLENRDLLYFDLHGAPGEGFWCGDGGIVALTAAQIAQVPLNNTIVFAANCYLADEDSPMMDALLEAGARYVIGGDGMNWAGQRRLYGASLLGLAIRQMMAAGIDPLTALTIGKKRLMLQLAGSKLLQRQDLAEAARDTLAFRAYYRRETDDEETVLV